jgi:hypothetical protein
MAEVLNRAGKSKAVEIGKNIKETLDFQTMLTKFKVDKTWTKIPDLMESLKKGVFEPELVTRLMNEAKLAQNFNAVVDDYLRSDLEPSM